MGAMNNDFGTQDYADTKASKLEERIKGLETELQRRRDEEDRLDLLPNGKPKYGRVATHLTQDQWNLEEERAKAENQVEYDAMMTEILRKGLPEYVSPAAQDFVPPGSPEPVSSIVDVFVPPGWSDWGGDAPLKQPVSPAARPFVPPDEELEAQQRNEARMVMNALDDYDKIESLGITRDFTDPIGDAVDDLVLRTRPHELPRCQIAPPETPEPLLTFEEYQAGAKKTAIYNKAAIVLYPALGLSGEVGEVIEKLLQMAAHAGKVSNQVKKIIRDDDCECDTPRKEDIGKEIGGVLWYCAAVCSDLGLDMGAIAQQNLDVLASRQERGVIQGDGDNR